MREPNESVNTKRGNSAVAELAQWRHAGSVVIRSEKTAPVRIVDTVPLLRAGLERLAASAGLSVSDDGPASIALRTHGQERVDCSIDIGVGWNEVSVTVLRPPAPGALRAAANLACVLLRDPSMRASWVFLDSARSDRERDSDRAPAADNG